MPYQPETQRPGDRRGLDQLDRHWIAKPVGLRMADERAACLVKAEIFVADSARRNESVGAGLIEFDEQTGARDT